VEDRIRTIMAEVLRLRTVQIGVDAAIGTVPNWDSVAHMRMMIALEEAFDIELGERRMVEMTSFAKIHAAVTELVAARVH
jgi:acyl carrier protein